jgi:hypothetical protein
MYIYNITIKVTWQIADEWLKWMHEVHIPEVLATGCFEKTQILKLLEVDDQEGPTYSFQYYAISKAIYNKYIELYAPQLRTKTLEKWGNNYMAFRSLLEIVN